MPKVRSLVGLAVSLWPIFRNLGHLSREPFALGESHVEAVRILQQRLSFGKPRTLDVMPLAPPILLFTDGALEYEPMGMPGGPSAQSCVTALAMLRPLDAVFLIGFSPLGR